MSQHWRRRAQKVSYWAISVSAEKQVSQHTCPQSRPQADVPTSHSPVSSECWLNGISLSDSQARAQTATGDHQLQRTKKKGTRAKRIECTQLKRHNDAFSSSPPRPQHMSLLLERFIQLSVPGNHGNAACPTMFARCLNLDLSSPLTQTLQHLQQIRCLAPIS